MVRLAAAAELLLVRVLAAPAARDPSTPEAGLANAEPSSSAAEGPTDLDLPVRPQRPLGREGGAVVAAEVLSPAQTAIRKSFTPSLEIHVLRSLQRPMWTCPGQHNMVAASLLPL